MCFLVCYVLFYVMFVCLHKNMLLMERCKTSPRLFFLYGFNVLFSILFYFLVLSCLVLFEKKNRVLRMHNIDTPTKLDGLTVILPKEQKYHYTVVSQAMHNCISHDCRLAKLYTCHGIEQNFQPDQYWRCFRSFIFFHIIF